MSEEDYCEYALENSDSNNDTECVCCNDKSRYDTYTTGACNWCINTVFCWWASGCQFCCSCKEWRIFSP